MSPITPIMAGNHLYSEVDRMELNALIKDFEKQADKFHKIAESYFWKDKETCAILDSASHSYEAWAMKLRMGLSEQIRINES